MAGESDQTKWVGVRPTDPAVVIPVTESAPLTNILTQKKAPAIADMQAIDAVLQFYDVQVLGAAGDYSVSTGVVPANKIWVATFINSSTNDDACLMMQRVYEDAALKLVVNRVTSTIAWQVLLTTGYVVLTAGQKLEFRYLTSIADRMIGSGMCGWQIALY